MEYLFLLICTIVLSVGSVAFINNAGRLKFIITSRPLSVILVLYLWLSFPDYNREWVDSYETRDGYRDVYETTFTGRPSRFQLLFEGHQDLAYGVLNTITLMFVLYAYYLVRYCYKLPQLFHVEMDIVGVIAFPVLFLFNPIDPLISYLPPSWALGVKSFYLVCLAIWFVFFPETKRLYRVRRTALSSQTE